MNWDQEFSRMDSKGKGKATNIDFDAAFTRAAASMTNQSSRIVEVQDDVESLETTFERTALTDSSEKERGADYLTDFQK
jgi:peroxin-5